MNGKNKTLPVKKDTYLRASPQEQSDLMYDLMEMNFTCICDIKDLLQKRRRIDTAFSGVMGVFGGFLAIASRWFFLKD